MAFYDMHCHMGFADDVRTLAARAADMGIEAFSATVTPDEYVDLLGELAPWPQFHVGLGLHPWWIADENSDADDLGQFEALAAEAPFIGEIGLDFSGSRGTGERRQRQIESFERILHICADNSVGGKDGDAAGANGAGKLVSLHAVRATTDVLDMLEKTDVYTRYFCIFHWFSGTSDDLARAIDMGCYFSVGSRMLNTKHGRAIAKEIPADRLMVETDSPSSKGTPWEAQAWESELGSVLDTLVSLREEDGEELARRIATTSASLLDGR